MTAIFFAPLDLEDGNGLDTIWRIQGWALRAMWMTARQCNRRDDSTRSPRREQPWFEAATRMPRGAGDLIKSPSASVRVG
jgi:hypothetical protein